MAALFRVTVVTTGFSGATGYTNLYAIHSDPPSEGAQDFVENVAGLFDGVAATMCEGWNWAIQSDVAVVEDTDGSIDSFISTTPPTQAVFATTGAYSAPSGVCIDWLTNTVVNSRKVMGRTFFVPLGGGFYENNGTLSPTAVATFQGEAAEYLASSGPTKAVWSRPYTAVPGKPRPTTPGSSAPIVARRVPDKAAVLRSRRD